MLILKGDNQGVKDVAMVRERTGQDDFTLENEARKFASNHLIFACV